MVELLTTRNIMIKTVNSGTYPFDIIVGLGCSKKKLISYIEKKYKFHVPVEIRTKREIENIIKNSPFGLVDLAEDGTKVLVTFLCAKPDKVKVANVLNYVVLPEKLVVKGKEVYLYCPNGYGKSRLSNNFLENKLGVEATTRNWKSVHKIYELSV